jgi:hypothetical protein
VCPWALGDYYNDGDNHIFAGTRGQASGNGTTVSKLFRNDGNGAFADVLKEAGLSGVDEFPQPSKLNKIRGGLWWDVDNDGDLDLFVVRGNGDEQIDDPPNLMYRNDLVETGTPTFTDITAQAGVAGSIEGCGEGTVYADYDGDGFLDVIVTNGDAPEKGPYQLFRNDGNSNHWFRVELQGTRSDVHAIGSRVWIFVGDIMQYREYMDFGVCFSQNERVACFGLGPVTTVDLLRVQWPDGVIQEWANLDADQQVTLTQPSTMCTFPWCLDDHKCQLLEHQPQFHPRCFWGSAE